MILFYDTETTGLPDWRAPSDAKTQPHLVQLAMLLTDNAGKEKCCANLIVRPDGWQILPENSAIHGITHETAEEFGISERIATELFVAWGRDATFRVAHNISFDDRLMRIAMLRAGYQRDQIEAIEKRSAFCTMQNSTHVVNLPPTAKMVAAGFNKPKAPRLEECIKHFFDEDLAGAHDAIIDVRACARVYFHLKALVPAA
jgi:DNA polymerase-3 subunit epsilon